MFVGIKTAESESPSLQQHLPVLSEAQAAVLAVMRTTAKAGTAAFPKAFQSLCSLLRAAETE